WEGIVFVLMYAGYIVWLVLDATENAFRDEYGAVAVFFVGPVVVITLVVLVLRTYRGRGAPA
ncbi:MAG: sodium:calcium antiporter, partial [Actinomycetota bacterium]